METIKYLVPKGTINRIKTAHAIGVKELELKPITFIALDYSLSEIIHAKSIPGILMDLDAAQVGWIRWKEGNFPIPEMSRYQRELVETLLNSNQKTAAQNAATAYSSSLFSKMQADALSKGIRVHETIERNKSDTSDALAFFTMLNNSGLSR